MVTMVHGDGAAGDVDIPGYGGGTDDNPAALSAIADAPAETTVYAARAVITMDPARPRAEAFAVRDGRFIAVGGRDEVTAAAGQGATRDDTFAGKVVVPGFVAPHVHPVLAALTMTTAVIAIEAWDTMDGRSAGVRDAAGYRERLLHALAAHHQNAGGPFVTWGYHQDFHGDMSRAFLDSLMTAIPVLVWHRSCREFYLNSAALAYTGIDAEFVAGLPASQRAQIDLDTGRIFGAGAIAVLDKLAPLMAPPQRLRQGLEFTETLYHRNGITLACEPGGLLSRPLQQAINHVYGDSATPFDHCFIADGTALAARHPPTSSGAAGSLIDATRRLLSWGEGRARYLPRQVKLFTDGALYSRTMQMRDSSSDGRAGAWVMHPTDFDAAFQVYWDAGYQVHVHAVGDGGLAVLLASLEDAMARNRRDDHRTVLASVAFAAPAQMARWAALGGIVSANPYDVEALAARYAAVGIGEDRARDMVPMANVLEHDLPFAFHSGMPMAPAKPLQLIYAAVNRLTGEGRIMGAVHQVPREAALAAVTLGAAHALRQEDSIGSIEVGKRANLTILEANPLEVPPTWIKDIPVWGTMLDGRLQPAPPATEQPTPAPRRAASADGAGGSEATAAPMGHYTYEP